LPGATWTTDRQPLVQNRKLPERPPSLPSQVDGGVVLQRRSAGEPKYLQTHGLPNERPRHEQPRGGLCQYQGQLSPNHRTRKAPPGPFSRTPQNPPMPTVDRCQEAQPHLPTWHTGLGGRGNRSQIEKRRQTTSRIGHPRGKVEGCGIPNTPHPEGDTSQSLE